LSIVLSAVGAIAPTAFREIQGFASEGLTARIAAEVDYRPEDFFGERNFRVVDRTGQLLLIAVERALKDAELDAEKLAAEPIGLIVGTLFGSLRTIGGFDRRGLEAGPKYVKPLDFANTVINAAAGQAAIWHNLWARNATVAGGATAGLRALAQAREAISNGRARALLAGGAEELSFEGQIGFERSGRLAAGNEPRPFDRRRDGLLLGEGAGLLLVESADDAAAHGRRARARLLGHGSAFDPSQGRDPGSRRNAVARAIRQALEDAEIEATAIELWSAGASGSIDLDRDEAFGMAQVVGERLAEIPVIAVKATTGELLGASGALQTIALIEAFTAGIPARADFIADPDLPPLNLDGRAAGARVGLLTALGLDGDAIAVLIAAA
jgi:3-oxoacyl-[acyl-carrier-protein] synthase II